MLKICQELQLLKSLCYWIRSFLQNRKIQLKFDGNSQKMNDIEIGIPQESLISPILFLIYIRFLFTKKLNTSERILSYLDDIGLVVSSKSIEENCQLLQKTAQALKILNQIKRLSNTERGLSFQAIRQLYIACISSVADYDVPVWWNNQKNMLERFQKLQNIALRKILDAFKTSSINAMKLEASIPPPKVRFERICKNYA